MHSHFVRLIATALVSIVLLLASRPTEAAQLAFVETQFGGVGGVNGLGGASSIAMSPDGKHAYVTGEEDNGIALFARDPMTGELTFVEALFDRAGLVHGMTGPQSVAISPDGAHAYVASLIGELAVFSRDTATGMLTFVGALFDNVDGVDGLGGASAIVVSSDGAHVYVVAALVHESE